MSALDTLYQQIILDHSKARHGADLPESDTARYLPGVGRSHQLNPVRAEMKSRSGWRWTGKRQGASAGTATVRAVGLDEAGVLGPGRVFTFEPLVRRRTIFGRLEHWRSGL